MAPSLSAAIYFCYKRCDIANYRALKVLYIVRLLLLTQTWQQGYFYMNVSSLASSCESQVFIWLQLAMRPKPAHLVQEDFDFLSYFEVFSFILVL